jgi:hypothetical protein
MSTLKQKKERKNSELGFSKTELISHFWHLIGDYLINKQLNQGHHCIVQYLY